MKILSVLQTKLDQLVVAKKLHFQILNGLFVDSGCFILFQDVTFAVVFVSQTTVKVLQDNYITLFEAEAKGFCLGIHNFKLKMFVVGIQTKISRLQVYLLVVKLMLIDKTMNLFNLFPWRSLSFSAFASSPCLQLPSPIIHF